MTLDQFFDENAQELGGVLKDLIGLQMPTKVSESEPKETGPMVWKQGKLEIANEMARGGLSGVDQYILNRYK